MSIGADTWPWIVLVAGIAGFVLGMLFGRPRLLADTWAVPGRPAVKACLKECSCGGAANCNIPIGPNHTAHCGRQQCMSGCRGFCTLNLPHAAPHNCDHGHTFP